MSVTQVQGSKIEVVELVKITLVFTYIFTVLLPSSWVSIWKCGQFFVTGWHFSNVTPIFLSPIVCQCERCKSVYHSECKTDLVPCPKCERRRLRLSSSGNVGPTPTTPDAADYTYPVSHLLWGGGSSAAAREHFTLVIECVRVSC